MTRKKIIVANWKMNHGISDTLKFVSQLNRSVLPTEKIDVVICPPHTSLYTISVALDASEIRWGAQNCHFEDNGAFTGEVSPIFLRELGCGYVIIGHSERRKIFLENDDFIAKKVNKSIELDIIPLLCIGESQEQRDKNQTFEVVKKQLLDVLNSIIKLQPEQILIAYEPVWAIGTGKTATAEQAQEVHAFIRSVFTQKYGADFAQKIRILYGGSVHSKNVSELTSQADIDGALIGGASLEVESFREILYQVNS